MKLPAGHERYRMNSSTEHGIEKRVAAVRPPPRVKNHHEDTLGEEARWPRAERDMPGQLISRLQTDPTVRDACGLFLEWIMMIASPNQGDRPGGVLAWGN